MMHYCGLLLLYASIALANAGCAFDTAQECLQSWTDTGMSDRIYPYGEEYGDRALKKHDESIVVAKDAAINYFGGIYTNIQLSWHGMMVFEESISYSSWYIWPNQNYPDGVYGEDPPLISLYYTEATPGLLDSQLYYRMIAPNPEQDEVQQAVDNELMSNFTETIHNNMLGSDHFEPTNAIIATWHQVVPGRCIDDEECTSSETPRNTFQLVVTYNADETYAIISYYDLNWPVAGDVEKLPQLGFNRGYGSMQFIQLPYSREDATGLDEMSGVGEGTLGRFVYSIGGDAIHRGGCTSNDGLLSGSSWPLEVYPESGPSIGGYQVTISGPCFQSVNNIQCIFGEGGAVTGEVVDNVRAVCNVPAHFNVGVIPLVVNVDGEPYETTFNFVSPGEYTGPHVSLVDIAAFFVPNPSNDLGITWDSADLAQGDEVSGDITVNVKLIGYREDASGPILEPDLHVFTTEPQPNSGEFEFNPTEHQCTSTCDVRVGMIRVERSDNPAVGLWSQPVALGWFAPNHDGWCSAVESDGVDWHDDLQQCPCTYQQAITDFANFIRDPDCSVTRTNHPCYLHPQAKLCFISIKPTASGAMSRCCYDENDMIIYTVDSTIGSFSARAHRDGSGNYQNQYQIPYLSYLYNDVTPYLGCCAWPEMEGASDPALCREQFLNYRPTVNCKNDETYRHGFAYGDPHFRTFDGQSFTFNGHGEYWLVCTAVTQEEENVNVQVRTEPPSLQYWTEDQLSGYMESTDEQGSGTIITAVAMQDGRNPDSELYPTVMVQLNPPTSVHSVAVFVNGNETSIGRADKRTQSFPADAPSDDQKVFIHSQLGDDRTEEEILHNVWDPRNITVVLPSGAGVQVAAKYGTLHVITALPPKFTENTFGLLGTWNNQTSDDLTQDPQCDGMSISAMNASAGHVSQESATGAYGADSYTDVVIQPISYDPLSVGYTGAYAQDDHSNIHGQNSHTGANAQDDHTGVYGHDGHTDAMVQQKQDSATDFGIMPVTDRPFVDPVLGEWSSNASVSQVNMTSDGSAGGREEKVVQGKRSKRDITEKLHEFLGPAPGENDTAAQVYNETHAWVEQQQENPAGDIEWVPGRGEPEDFPDKYPKGDDGVGLYNNDDTDENLVDDSSEVGVQNSTLNQDNIAVVGPQVVNGTAGDNEVVWSMTDNANDAATDDFGKQQGVSEEASRFYYLTMGYDHYNGNDFNPLFTSELPDPTQECSSLCSGAYTCEYDCTVTGRSDLAQQSLNMQIWATITQLISGPGLGPMLCPMVEVDNSLRVTTGYVDGSTMTFTGCNDGYSMSGGSEYTCQNGQWVPSVDTQCKRVDSAGEWWVFLLIAIAILLLLLLLVLLFLCCRHRQRQKQNKQASTQAEKQRLANKQKEQISVIPMTDADAGERTSVTNPHYHDEISPDGQPYDAWAHRVEYDNPALEQDDDLTPRADLGPGLINQQPQPKSRTPSQGSRGSRRSNPPPRPVVVIPVASRGEDDPTYDNRPYEDDPGLVTSPSGNPDETIPVYTYDNSQPANRIKLPAFPGGPPPPDSPSSSATASTDTVRRAIPRGPYTAPEARGSLDYPSSMDESFISELEHPRYATPKYSRRERPEPDYPYQPRLALEEDMTLV